MDNKTRKDEYLKSLAPTARNEFIRVAKAAQPFEERFGKDLSNFNRDEVIQVVNSTEPTSPLTVKQYLHRIRQYQITIGELDDSLITPITKDEIDIVHFVQKHFYKSFEDVLTEIQKVRELTGGYPEPVLLGFAWLGVDSKIVGQIEANQVDLTKGTLTLLGKHGVEKIEIEPSVLKTFRAFRNISVAYRSTNTEFEVYPENTPYFLRRMLSRNSKKTPKPYSDKDIGRILSDLRRDALEDGITIDLTYNNVQRSGELYRIYLLEQSGVNVFCTESQKRVCALANTSVNHFYDLSFQYQAYKEAFNLD